MAKSPASPPDTPLPPPTSPAPSPAAEDTLPWLEEMPPRKIVAELDRYIVGQEAAKKAVAIAVRNRWRRAQAPEDIRDEIMPNNIIMIGPTGVGKTEIARRLAASGHIDFINVIRGHIDSDEALTGVIPIMGMRSAPHLDFAGEVRDAVYRQKVQEYVAYWYGDLKDRTKIEDMRGTSF